MATANLTVRVDEGVKKEFDIFCENVGINATSAVNMFIKTVIRTRTLPFVVTDIAVDMQEVYNKLEAGEASIQAGRVADGVDSIRALREKYRV